MVQISLTVLQFNLRLLRPDVSGLWRFKHKLHSYHSLGTIMFQGNLLPLSSWQKKVTSSFSNSSMWHTNRSVNMIKHHCQCGTYEGHIERHEHCQIMNRCQETLQCAIYDNQFHLQSNTRMKIMSPTLSCGHIAVWQNGWWGHVVLAMYSDSISCLGENPSSRYSCMTSMHIQRDACMRPSSGRWQVKHFNPLNAELNPICHLLALLGAHHILHISRIRVKEKNPDITDHHNSGCPRTVLKQWKNWTHRREWMCDNQGNGNKD
jgi:hypothetical protein